MRLLFVHDHRFVEAGGLVYSNQFPASVLQRYLGVFDSLTFVGRRSIGSGAATEGLLVSSTQGVDFVLMPDISSLDSFLGTRGAVRKEVAKLLQGHDRVIVRLPSELGLLTAATARAMGRSYAVELVGDPWDALWYYGTVTAKLYAPVVTQRTRRAVRRASAVSYVTSEYLQNRYPPSTGAATAHISNVSISSVVDPALIKEPKAQSKRIRIGIIGSLRTRYKGLHTAIDAVARLAQNGSDVELRVLGSGDPKALLAQAEQLQVLHSVFFDGTLPSGASVQGWLDQLDIYAQPSLTEGLPRALIEAMSRGLPAVASKVGGMPELLAEEYLFRAGDEALLADRLSDLITSPERRSNASKTNIETATSYLSGVLDARRVEFLCKIRAGIISDSAESELSD